MENFQLDSNFDRLLKIASKGDIEIIKSDIEIIKNGLKSSSAIFLGIPHSSIRSPGPRTMTDRAE